MHKPALDDASKVVKVVASDGKTGEQQEIQYTSCKVVGNGSFGVVFQAKLISPDGSPVGDVAIKKVLQDKRFKVSSSSLTLCMCVWGEEAAGGLSLGPDPAEQPLHLRGRSPPESPFIAQP